jgi:hypothetical protein
LILQVHGVYRETSKVLERLGYLKLHWRGQQSIAQSLLVNGALAYGVIPAVTVILAVALNPSTNAPNDRFAAGADCLAWLVCRRHGSFGCPHAERRRLQHRLQNPCGHLLLWTDVQIVARWDPSGDLYVDCR